MGNGKWENGKWEMGNGKLVVELVIGNKKNSTIEK